jgi:hypothetical protein
MVKLNQKNSQKTVLLLICLFSFSLSLHDFKETTSASFLQLTQKSRESTTFIAKGTCTATNCKDPYGKCTDGQTCQCNKGFAQMINKTVQLNQNSCSYEMYRQKTAFMLEFFLPFGVGHFYSGRISFGIGKLFFIVIVLIMDFILIRFIYKSNEKSIKTQRFGQFFILFLYFSLIVFHVVDLCMWGLNKWRDGNAMPYDEWGVDIPFTA